MRTAGAVGTDPSGEMLLSLLHSAGVDTSMVKRKPDVSTSMSVLPIRPDGERPSLHLLGANLAYTADDVDLDAVAAADHVHLGGTEMLGPDFDAPILEHARDNGTTTSVDLIAPGGMGTFDLIAPALAYTDYLLLNAEQVLGFTGASDLADCCRRLSDAGAGGSPSPRARREPLLSLTMARSMFRHSPSMSSTPLDAVTRFSAGFVVGMGLELARTTPPCLATPPRRSSLRASAATPAISTWPLPTPSRVRPRQQSADKSRATTE